jgi:Tol biopolymer transport system component
VPLTPGRAGEVFPASSSFYDGSSQFSPDGGRLALESMRSGDRLEIWLAAADGHDPVQLTRGPGRWQGSPAWSPDGRRIAFDSQGEDGRWDIWTVDVEGGAPRHLTQHPGDENLPSWSQDGRWVYFSAVRNGKWGISRVPAEGGAEERIVQADTSSVYHVGQESRDGKTLFFTQGRNRFAESPLFAHPLAGGPAKKLLDCVSGPKGFAIAGGDVYYTACGAGPDKQLRRLHLATGNDAVVGVLKMYRGEVTVSPDGKIILYTSETQSGSDLMLWEGFR